MKNLYYIVIFFVSLNGWAQHEVLNENQVRAKINASGILFTENIASRASYEVPKTIDGSGADLIFASSFSYGAIDLNGTIHLAASKFISDPKDLFTGPIAIDYNNLPYYNRYNRIYTVSSNEIIAHQQNWNNPNYAIPLDILYWPGNGNTTNGEASLLAPFVDYNSNNIYEPLLGDHPYIRGDKASYFILNDAATSHAHTQSDPLGMEFHYMIYQYETNNFLDSATFINIRIVNRSQTYYNQFIVANYTDFDIGGPGDDYVGCSSQKNMIFGYNGDANDDAPAGGSVLFGDNPPACAIQLLNHQMGTACYYANAAGVQGDPNTTIGFWSNMNGNWSDGSSFTLGGDGYGGTTPTNYVFDGNPNDSTIWTELSENNNPGDRRAFMASEPIDNFAPNDYICYDFAVLYSRTGGNNLLNVNGLFDVADSVQLFYDSQSYYYCEPLLLSNKELVKTDDDLKIYPNPAHDQFSVSIEGNYSLEIYDISGKLVTSYQNLNSSEYLQVPNESGVYLVKVIQNEKHQTLKLLVE